MRPSFRSLLALGLAGACGAARPAFATWSIILVDIRTGEVAVGSATCLTNFDLRASTPVLLPGIGGAAAQSAIDSTGQNRVFIRDRLATGVVPQDILTQLAAFDSMHQSRQYGIVDAHGNASTFSGTGAGAYVGGVSGQFAYTNGAYSSVIAYAIQGNVLTGPPVIDHALQAVMTTSGDLPARLMAGMQAARSMGGDGRCSCSPSAPNSCGSPPPSFTKSADIGYMLVGRIGDREGSDGVYRAGSNPFDIAAINAAAGALPALVVSNQSSANLSVLGNVTPASHPFPMFGPVPTTYSVGGSPRGIAIADTSGDTHPDILVADANIGAFKLLRGNAGGFDPFVTFPVGAGPRAIAVADFDGQPGLDVAAACFSGGGVGVCLNNGAGGFGPSTLIPTDAGPMDIVAANLIGTPAIDLAVACRTAARLDILAGDGAGHFTLATSLPTVSPPLALAAADLDGDGSADLATICDSAQSVQVFLNQGGTFASATYPLGFTPSDLAIGDINGDGRRDIVVAGGTHFATLMNTGNGLFTLTRTYTVAGTVAGVTLADLDGDGDLDIALASPGLSSAITVKNYGPGPLAGVFNDGAGCATGDYYLNFNVAFQTATDPDPVDQLQALYDQWRAGLAGRPDAVLSLTSLSPPILPANGTAASTLTITLRDWQGHPITSNITAVNVTHAPASAGICTIGPVVPQGNGVYTATITAGLAAGLDRFRVVVDDGVRPVTLMPDPSLPLLIGCYANCDGSTAAPILAAADFTCFLQRFSAGDPYANCDGSTTPPVLNIMDFACFLHSFAQGCP